MNSHSNASYSQSILNSKIDLLKKNTQCIRLNLALVDATQLDKLVHLLQSNTSLLELELAGCPNGSLHVIIEALINNKLSRIHTLEIRNCNIMDDDASAIAKLIVNTTTITSLNLISVNVRHAMKTITDAIALNSSLKVIRLIGNRLGYYDAKLISQSLTMTKACVTKLDMQTNDIGPRGIIEIANMLSLSTSIEELNLSSNIANYDICQNDVRETLDEFANALVSNKSLKKLDLSNNNFPCKTIVKIFEALVQNQSLNVIHIDDKYRFGMDENLSTKIINALYENYYLTRVTLYCENDDTIQPQLDELCKRNKQILTEKRFKNTKCVS